MAKPLSKIFRSTLKKKREASLYFFSRARRKRRSAARARCTAF